MAEIRRVQRMFSWVVIVSEISHVFCCVLPTIFSVLTLLVGMGLIGVMPHGLDFLHDAMHGYEIPLMVISGAVVLMGWGVHLIAQRIDCHDTGCGHGKCTPKKKNALTILKVATALFFINISIYMVFHIGMPNYVEEAYVIASEHDRHHDHEH